MDTLPSRPTGGPTLPVEQYNFRRFRPKHLLMDLRLTMRRAGLQPGETAPDFELPTADGGSLRLHDLRGRPVLVRFGSFT